MGALRWLRSCAVFHTGANTWVHRCQDRSTPAPLSTEIRLYLPLKEKADLAPGVHGGTVTCLAILYYPLYVDTYSGSNKYSGSWAPATGNGFGTGNQNDYQINVWSASYNEA